MSVSRWFYWMLSFALVILVLTLGGGWVALYRSEDNRIREDIDNVVRKTAEKVQNANYILYDIVKVLTDKDYKEKVAFAAGMTQNQAKLAMNFDEDSLQGPAHSRDKEKKDSVTLTITPTGEKPLKYSFSKKWLDTSKKYVPAKVKTLKYYDSLLTIQMKKEHLDVPYHIEKVPLHVQPVKWASGLFIINFYDPVVYRLVYSIPPALIVRRLLPYTGKCLLLLMLFAGAFIMYHRGYRLQMHMAQFRESLFSNVTHELKTPLSSLQLIVNSFKEDDTGLSPKQQEYIDFADKEVQRMNLLVEKILSFGKLDQEQFALNKEIINLPGLINEAIQIMNITAGNKNARIIFEPEIDCEITGDKVLLLNMLVNIIDNAIKYNTNSPRIRIVLEQEDKHVKMLVTDNGIGIQQQYYSKIFEPFFRVPSGNEHNVKGHGLGLSFTQQVIKMHSGKISLESEPGKGSVFIIHMPSF